MRYITSSEQKANPHVAFNRYVFNAFQHLFIIKSNFHRLDWKEKHLNIMHAEYDLPMTKVLLSEIVFLRVGTRQ